MKEMDWPKFDIGRTPQEDMDRQIVKPISMFFLGHTKTELWEEGVRRRVMVYPVNDAEGVLKNAHLKERGFWVKLEHSHLNDTLTYPGAFIKTQEVFCKVRCRAPLIGEHNGEIYGKGLGLSKERMAALKKACVI